MGPPLVDLRSDTVTRPTPEMRRAMAEAEVGDDGYGEDPSVNALEAFYAERVGMASAVFVPSGTMANQIALRVLGRPGTLALAGRRQHLVAYEAGAGGRNADVQLQPLDDADGTVDPSAVSQARAATAHHQPEVSLVCLENPHMAASGALWPGARWKEVLAASDGLPVHLDGARLFNAEVAAGVPAATLAAGATTVMTCLTKGLCAPVGSVLAGPADVIDEARVERKRLGGGMRQAGVVAAAALVGLRTMVERLAEDHARAQTLAEGVAGRWPASLDPAVVRTNIVVFTHADPEALLAHLGRAGVAAGTLAPGVVRFVTHREVDDEGVDRVRAALDAAPG
jgi:threonine aldolase